MMKGAAARKLELRIRRRQVLCVVSGMLGGLIGLAGLVVGNLWLVRLGFLVFAGALLAILAIGVVLWRRFG